MEESARNGVDQDTIEWMRMGTLAFDSMSCKAKVKFYPHSNELIGFEQGALKEDVLLKELDALDKSSAYVNIRPDITQKLLISIYTS